MYKSYYKPISRSKPHRKQEESLQLRICQYLRNNYLHILFRSDFASGLYLSPFQASKHAKLQSGRSWPDLIIYEPSANGEFPLMALELKREGVKVILKNGKLPANPHIHEQADLLSKLRLKGYYAEFAVGYDDAIKQIQQYLGMPIQTELDF